MNLAGATGTCRYLWIVAFGEREELKTFLDLGLPP